MRRISRAVLVAGAAAVCAVGCGPKPNAQGVLRVTITLEPGATARCAILHAEPATGTPQMTKPMPFNGQSQILAGVYQGDMGAKVTLTAEGYSDDGCTTPTVPAETATAAATFVAGQITDVAMSLSATAQIDGGNDGGHDGGEADGGSDGGADGGFDAGVFCNVTGGCGNLVVCNGMSCAADAGPNQAVCAAGVCTEINCTDGIDNDRNGQIDCADPSCDQKACVGAGTCRDAGCYGGTVEICNDGVDNNGNGLIDCAEPACNGQQCAHDNTCFPGDVCAGADGGADGGICVRTSAADLICNAPPNTQCYPGSVTCSLGCNYSAAQFVAGTSCVDAFACTVLDACQANGTCSGTAKTCTTPPFNPECLGIGTCIESDGGTCAYTVNSGAPCDAGLACQTGACSGAGACALTNLCTSPPAGLCWVQDAGACTAGGCAYFPLTGSTCDDGNNCTVTDQCLADGGCQGTGPTCTSTECKPEPGTCNTTPGVCDFSLTAAGTRCNGDAGTCDGVLGTCVPIDAGTPFSFPYTVSNVDWTTLTAYVDAGTRFVPPCTNTVVNTTPTPPTVTGTGGGASCVVIPVPPFKVVTQGAGVPDAVVFVVNELTINSGRTVTMNGSRPVIWVVFGDAGIAGTLIADAGADPTACGNGLDGTRVNNISGGGGAGSFGLDGGNGGNGNNGGGAGVGGLAGALNGTADLRPVRGGCSGAIGGSGGNGAGVGGVGGGAVQISASNRLDVSNVISAPGQGGLSGQPAGNNETAGGGGGSGGAILLEAATLAFTGGAHLAANGGSGGKGQDNGNNVNDGSMGGSTTASATTTGGGCGGPGGRGGASANGPQSGGTGGSSNGCRAGGGGGGSVGRIRLNALASCNSGAANTISPTHTSGGITTCRKAFQRPALSTQSR